MHKVNGMIIVPVRRGGVRGHVMRTRSGVKVAMFIGDDSLQRALTSANDGTPGHRRETPTRAGA